MRASYKWLKELCLFDATPEQVAERFTAAGLEVEGQKRYGELPGVVVAEVLSKRPHPAREKLSLVTVFDGERELEVVCGAPNVPAPKKRVLFAQSGARLPNGMEIGERNLGGVVSNGMICSESELDIGGEGDGIIVLADELMARPGTPASQALGLEDVVFEIGLTPNRPDCLGHVGLARELSALLGAPMRLPFVATPPNLRSAGITPAGVRPIALFGAPPASGAELAPEFSIAVADGVRCPRYAAAVVDGVTVAPSPFWLRYRLHVLGSRAINNIVDITNLVLLEYGYPTHAFDYQELEGQHIEVRTARPAERIATLDGMTRELSVDDLLICDAERPLAVAGVMGGQSSGVDARTRRVLVECAYFDPRSVRRTSRRLGLHTDASHRFERGVDPRAVPGVLARVVSLILEIAGGATAPHGFEVYPEPIRPREIKLRSERLEGLLGIAIPEGRSQAILEALGCEVERANRSFSVRAPTWRPDLTREEDLIEEVARIAGYDTLPTEVPRVRPSLAATQPRTRLIRKLKERAAAIGLTEAVNLAFTSPKLLADARVSTDAVRIANPLSEERSVLRTSLLPGLLVNVARAERHQVPSVSLFELARVFAPSGELLPTERPQLGFVLAGERTPWVGARAAYDFYDAKGLLEALCAPFVRRPIEAVSDEAVARAYPQLHPRRVARVLVAGAAIGFLGELHPDVAEAFGLTRASVYAELDVEALLDAVSEVPPKLRPLPRFPASSRDLAVVVDEASEAGAVAAAVRAAGGSLVEAVELFDLYRGGQLPVGKKSLAFRITYRDPEATLTDARVDEAHARVVLAAERQFAAALRA